MKRITRISCRNALHHLPHPRTRSIVLLLCALSLSAPAQPPTLSAVFTPTPIRVDAQPAPAWDKAAPSGIAICTGASPGTCQVSATVRALWNGPLLYLLFTVTSLNIAPTSGVQIFVDQFDDKFPKFEEDDGYIVIGADGRQTGNRTNAGLMYYPPVWSAHLHSYAAAPRLDAAGRPIGYTVEVAWSIGDLPLKNGTKLGMEFVVHAGPHELHWSAAQNKGLDDNTMWGDVVLSGYDGASPMQLNTFMLEQNIRKATPASSSADGLVRGIWKDETALDRALAGANAALHTAATQSQIDSANAALETALGGLRRAGKYPDPYDLPALNTLPDPFTFLNGARVRTRADWDQRRAEIRSLAQYYEFGIMPAPPKSLTAVSSPGATASLKYNTIAVAIQDLGRAASFQPVLYLPSTGAPPYPVIVEEDFRASPTALPPNRAYLEGGYAVLSIPTWDSAKFNLHGIASDDGNHTGAFFTLYPYRLDGAGNDRGVLLAWAWGASRGVDALEYLAAHDPVYANLLDLKKLVVTGFSRWGKAALLAGFLDDRFQVTAPGGSGSGGAAPYRYDSFGSRPFRATFGNVYPWGRSPGAESLPDHIRHQTHNSNEIFRRFLNQPRMYRTSTPGYGDRLPFDHHEEIAAIAPRAVIIDNTNDDYADNAEGDAIGYEGAKPVFEFLGVPQNLALDIFMAGGGHSLKPAQAANIVNFANFVLYRKPLPAGVSAHLATDPYRDAGAYDTYYGGLHAMMPWSVPGP